MSTNPDLEITIVEDDEVAEQPLRQPRASEDVEMGSPVDAAGATQPSQPPSTMDVEEVPSRIPFLDYLKSPMIVIEVGSGDNKHTLSAHTALLTRSSFLASQAAESTTIALAEHELDPVACFLEWLYTGEYFPRITTENDPQMGQLETDPSLPAVDATGEQILKHAKVYTLADKFGLQDLKHLAHSKIHRVNSSARGEIAYARYVYRETPEDDQAIRKPVAAFWAHRSHVLRHDAEHEFRTMCLDFPKFAYDVLSLVLDQKEKGKGDHLGEGSARRKRPRTTTGA